MDEPRTSDPEAPARAFILKLGRGLHAYGYPAHRLEDALSAVAERLGLEGQFFSTPTALFASFGPTADQRTFQVRVDPGGQELDKLSRLDAVAAEVARGQMTPAEGSHRVDEIEKAPPLYGPGLSIACFALGSGAATRFLGGGPREIAVSLGIGVATGLLALGSGRVVALRRVFEPVAAMVAATLAGLAAASFGPLSVQIATLGGLIILVPGFPLTVAMTELATQNLMSGTARLAGAIATFLLMGFGVALGTQVAQSVVGVPAPVTPAALPEWTLLVALLIAPLTFTVLLRAPRSEAPWILAAGALGFAGTRLGAALMGSELGAFVGALVVGVASNVYARVRQKPAAVTIVPGILLLVPGSLGFRSLSSLLERETITGVETAFRMALVAVALATGLLFSNVIAPVPPLRGRELTSGPS